MSVRVVVDMNLSVEWIPVLEKAGWPAVHWSAVGDPRADDAKIMTWALTHGCVVFTHDLDFGTALALPHRGYEFAARSLDEVGRTIGGWIRQQEGG